MDGSTRLTKEGFSVRRIAPRAVAVAALSVGLSIGISGLAYAASYHAISGTVYSGCSDSGPWYVSSTARTKDGTGPIMAQFSEINDGGLTFKLVNKFNVLIGNQQSWEPNETDVWRTLSSSVPHGTVFYTAFRSSVYECPDDQDEYEFRGTLFY